MKKKKQVRAFCEEKGSSIMPYDYMVLAAIVGGSGLRLNDSPEVKL